MCCSILVSRVILRACMQLRQRHRGPSVAPRDLRIMGDVHHRLPYVIASMNNNIEVTMN